MSKSTSKIIGRTIQTSNSINYVAASLLYNKLLATFKASVAGTFVQRLWTSKETYFSSGFERIPLVVLTTSEVLRLICVSGTTDSHFVILPAILWYMELTDDKTGLKGASEIKILKIYKISYQLFAGTNTVTGTTILKLNSLI